MATVNEIAIAFPFVISGPVAKYEELIKNDFQDYLDNFYEENNRLPKEEEIIALARLSINNYLYL